MAFSAHNLSCARGELTILSALYFEVGAGQATILRGPNGSGKTTLLRVVAGLTPHASGSLDFSFDDVAYAAHSDGLKTQLTVAGNLQFWAKVYGASNITPAIEAFALGDLLDRHVMHLSAGQKRRVSLARLLITGRPYWALDEPTVSLDAEAVRWFATAVQRHLDDGGSALIATHIDLGLPEAQILDITPFRHTGSQDNPFLDEAFL